MKGLGDMSSDEQMDGHNGDSMLPQIFFGDHKKNLKDVNVPLNGIVSFQPK